MKEILIEVRDDGTLFVDMNGYEGGECLRDHQKLVKLLEEGGIHVEERRSNRKREEKAKRAVKQKST